MVGWEKGSFKTRGCGEVLMVGKVCLKVDLDSKREIRMWKGWLCEHVVFIE